MGRFAADPDLNKDLTGILLNLVWIPSHYMTSFANIVIFRLCILNNKLIIIRLSNMLYLNMNFIFIDRGLWGCVLCKPDTLDTRAVMKARSQNGSN